MKRGQDKPGTKSAWNRRYIEGGLPHYEDRKKALERALARGAYIQASPVLGRVRVATRMQEDLERMEKEGVTKRVRTTHYGGSTSRRTWALVNPPEPKVVEVREPYKKRKAMIAELQEINKCRVA